MLYDEVCPARVRVCPICRACAHPFASVPGFSQPIDVNDRSFGLLFMSEQGEEGHRNEEDVKQNMAPSYQKRAKLTVPRWSISRTDSQKLETIFKEVSTPSLALRQQLATEMGVTSRQVWGAMRAAMTATERASSPPR